METLKKVMYAGLGLVQQTEEKIKNDFTVLVEKGKVIDDNGKNVVNDLFKTIEDIRNTSTDTYKTTLTENIEKVEEFLQTLKPKNGK
jgi:polyhydroxyalkanoate synthesis regulator phasin